MHATTRATFVTLLCGALLGATGCSSAPAPSTATTISVPAPTTASTQASPTEEPTPTVAARDVDVASLPGTVTVSAEDLEAVCSGGRGDEQLMPGGYLLVTCGDNALYGIDALTGVTAWSRTSGSSDDVGEEVSVGIGHVFIVETTAHPAEGLHDSYVTRRLIALGQQDGREEWAVPLGEWQPRVDRDAGLRPEVQVVESGTRDGSLRSLVGVSLGQWTQGFDASTGHEVWLTTDRSEVDEDASSLDYVGDGVLLDADSTHWTAYDADSHQKLWSVTVPLDPSGDITLHGSLLSQEDSDGILEVDVRNGRIALSRRFPSGWLGAVVTREYALALVGNNLQMFRITDVRSPLWSVTAGTVEPLAVGDAYALVQAEGGNAVLDARNGETRDDIAAIDQSPANVEPVDGLIRLEDGSVFVIGKPKLSDPAATPVQPSASASP